MASDPEMTADLPTLSSWGEKNLRKTLLLHIKFSQASVTKNTAFQMGFTYHACQYAVESENLYELEILIEKLLPESCMNFDALSSILRFQPVYWQLSVTVNQSIGLNG